jgi:hypothetical protein
MNAAVNILLGLVLGPVVVVALGLAAPAAAGAADRGRSHADDVHAVPSKTGQPPDKAAASGASHVTHDGGSARQLWIDDARVVEFPADGGRPAIRAAQPGELDSQARNGRPDAKASAGTTAGASPAVSPLFKDAAGQPRALAGGVIVGLTEALPPEEASARLAADGLTPVRQINARMWLVESPVGLASLDLANRLQESGRYDFVQPNWWKPRTTK